MKIYENKYKLGQRVGVTDLDTPMRIWPGYVVGIEIGRNEPTYTIADEWDKIYGYKYISDGWEEKYLHDENCINT